MRLQPTLEQAAAARGEHPIGLIIGSPSNPTGTLIDLAESARLDDFVTARGVAATPDIDFGANGTARFIRFAYTRAFADLEEGVGRMRPACAG